MQREMEEHSQSQETFVQERKKLLEECQSAHEQRVAALETCHETQQERDDLSERLAEIQVELQSFKDNHSYEDVYVLELEDLYESKAARVQHLEAALHQAETLEEESSSARAAAAREVSRLEEEVQNLKDAQQDAETSRQGHGFAREVERTEAQAALEGTQTQLCHLEQLLEGKSQEVDRLEHELREAERHSTELIQELQTFKEQFSLLEGDLKTTRNELETCKTDFSQRISEAAEETESLLESLQEAGKREVKLQADYDKAVEDLQEVDIELASLRSALNDQQHEDTITALKNELYQAQTALEQAQEPAVEEEEQEEEAEVVAELLSQQSMVQSSPIRQRRRSRHSTTPNTPQRNLATATILVARLRAERDSAKADGEFAQAEQSIALQKLRSQVAELREANAQLEGHLQQLRSLPSETSDMEASLQRMTVERDELSHTLENQSSKVRSLEVQCSRFLQVL